MNDAELETKISALKDTIYAWANKHHLWHDAGFKTFDEHFDVTPWNPPCVLVLWHDGPLHYLFNGYMDEGELIDEFSDLIRSLGFHFEMSDGVTTLFFPEDDTLAEEYRRYFAFRRLCNMITPDFDGVYQELFDHFSQHPNDLEELEPRRFEQLLESVFRNFGYRTELGPGWGDKGVDLRLYQKDAIGEIVTLVQAKRYGRNKSIRLDAVAALQAIVDDERANRGLFVTTSRYLPGVKKFAERQNRKLQLATSEDIVSWCSQVSARLYDLQVVNLTLSTTNSENLVGTVVHTRWGHNMIINDFAIIIKETPQAVLLMSIESEIVNHDGYKQSGYERPVVPSRLDGVTDKRKCFPAKKKGSKDNISFWGDNSRLYFVWNGEPNYFDYRD